MKAHTRTAGLGMTPALKAHLMVLAGAVCISFAAFFVKDAPMDPSMVAFYRLLFGSAALFAVAVIRGERLIPSKPALSIIMLAGFLFCCDLLTWHASIVLVGPGIATILANFQVLFLAIYGVVFLKERMSFAQKAAIPLALIGLSLLLGLHEKALPQDVWRGVGLCLLSALFYTGYILTLRRSQSMKVRLGPVANMAWVSFFACVFVCVFCAGKGISFEIPDVRTVIVLAALGVLCQSLGWLLLSLGLPHLPPFRAGLIMLTQPALAYTWDVIFYGTATNLVNVGGAVFAIVAIGLGILSRPKPSAGTEPEDEPMLRASMHPAGESGRLEPIRDDRDDS